MTIDITNATKELELPERLTGNLELLIEIRDNAIHFMNDTKLFEKKFLEIGTSSLKSYVKLINAWFDYDLSQYNFYLMPISFFYKSGQYIAAMQVLVPIILSAGRSTTTPAPARVRE